MKNNKDFFIEALKYIPGGINSPLRAFNEVDSNPICVSKAKGAYIYDVTGKRYIDFLLGFGPVILGHAPEAVIQQISEQIMQGSVYAATNIHEIELAKLIIESTKGLEQVRFVCSGTEAVMSAVRLAKGYTGREKILKFDGSYHGHADSVLGVRVEEGQETRLPIKGIDRAIHNNTFIVQYNDIDAVKKVFETYGTEIACILVEPYACNMGLVEPMPGFLETLKDMCDMYGSQLIFDEVITGFRMTYGSVWEELGVEPDLITFGKVIGGGLPIGAYAGKREIMKLVIDEEQGVYQSGTFAGNALSMVGGIAVLMKLRKTQTYQILEDLEKYLEESLTKKFLINSIPYVLQRKGSVFSLITCDIKHPIRNYDDVLTQDFSIFAKLHKSMLEKGFLLPPAADEVMHLSLAHTKQDIDEFCDALINLH